MNSAEVILDSISPNGTRLTTMVVTFPRFILPEFNTHRMFSRNGSSSRAIPVKKMLDKVIEEPFVPSSFNFNAKGMQGGEALPLDLQQQAEQIWLEARNEMVIKASKLLDLGVSKQYANRLLEAFGYTTMVVTATEFANFFALRNHSAAQPEIRNLAEKMWEAYKQSTPKYLDYGEWHLPFVTEEEKREQALQSLSDSGEDYDLDTWRQYWEPLIKMSVARCARVSYLNHDSTKPTQQQDFDLYDRLLKETPKHSSPAENQARPMEPEEEHSTQIINNKQVRFSGNFREFVQYRKLLDNENITTFTGPLG